MNAGVQLTNQNISFRVFTTHIIAELQKGKNSCWVLLLYVEGCDFLKNFNWISMFKYFMIKLHEFSYKKFTFSRWKWKKPGCLPRDTHAWHSKLGGWYASSIVSLFIRMNSITWLQLIANNRTIITRKYKKYTQNRPK